MTLMLVILGHIWKCCSGLVIWLLVISYFAIFLGSGSQLPQGLCLGAEEFLDWHYISSNGEMANASVFSELLDPHQLSSLGHLIPSFSLSPQVTE